MKTREQAGPKSVRDPGAPRSPRVVKAPDVRRGELLDCAQALFFERGYERTTINDIIERAGVSKGGFYHHFTSKEEVLEALASKVAQESVARFADVLTNPNLDALTRLNAFFARGRQINIEDAPRLAATFDALYKPDNIVLYQRIHTAVTPVVVPMLASIVGQGIAEGTFKVTDAEAAAELMIQISASTRDVLARAFEVSRAPEASVAMAAVEARLRFHGIAIDRILGLPDGSVVHSEPGFVLALVTARRAR